MERQIRTRSIHSGKLFSVRSDTVEIGGRETVREVVDHPGGIGILPVTVNGAILLVEHYRYAIDKTLLEIPAGTREPGESAAETARRELDEETGYRAMDLAELCRFFASPGWSTEEIVLFRATVANQSGHAFDHDEILQVVELDPARIPGLMRDGLIADAKTIIALRSHWDYPL